LQVENHPMPGTGIGSFASPPSSFTRAAPALMSSTAKYGRVPRFPGSMLVIAAPCSPPICVVWYSNGPGFPWNCHPNRGPQNSWLLLVSSAGISMCTISPGNAVSSFVVHGDAAVSPSTARPVELIGRRLCTGYVAIFVHVIEYYERSHVAFPGQPAPAATTG